MRWAETLRTATALPLQVALTVIAASTLVFVGCDGDSGPLGANDAEADADTAEPPDGAADTRPTGPPADVYSPASGCFTVRSVSDSGAALVLTASDTSFAFASDDGDNGAALRFRAADLGTYLLYATDRTYVAAEPSGAAWVLNRPSRLQTAVELLDDTFVSPAEWHLQPHAKDPTRYQLQHAASGGYLATAGVADTNSDAAVVELVAADDCAVYPELSLDAMGEVVARTWDDGSLYGIAEIHSHLNTNMGFGGGGIFHGAPFHRLGVEYALPDCDVHHGEDGKRDIVGFFYDGDANLDLDALLPIVASGAVDEFNHATAGYPDFSEWPNPRLRSTHQAMYYRWLERAYRGGLRLMVELATTNSVLCELVLATKAQGVRYDCNDMVNVQREIQATRDMERYIDAQSGGPGQGWFRVVETPQQAREVIEDGKLAVVIGIEVSNLFDCFSVPKPGFEACTPESVAAELDAYKALGVTVVFPVHKYDNAFTAGDGSSGVIELGNMLNSGHYSNFVDECPGIATTFDGGSVTFGGLNQPRENYDDPPPIDVDGWVDNLIGTVLPFAEALQEPSLPGEWCQQHGMTPLGEGLVSAIMDRGMLLDIGHLPQRSLTRVYELLEANDYPATKTHGGSNNGRLYGINGLRGSNIQRCASADEPGTLLRGLRDDVADRVEAGQYPAEAMSFDLNGFAGNPGPRFGAHSSCSDVQENPVTYPFTSVDGTVVFEQPRLGTRNVDFNTEGMIHIGLLPELLEDAKRDGATNEDLEPFFRSAEAYVRMWEQAEAAARKR